MTVDKIDEDRIRTGQAINDCSVLSIMTHLASYLPDYRHERLQTWISQTSILRIMNYT